MNKTMMCLNFSELEEAIIPDLAQKQERIKVPVIDLKAPLRLDPALKEEWRSGRIPEGTSYADHIMAYLSPVAWHYSEKASLCGEIKVKVGAAVLSTDNRIYGGCNIEQLFRVGNIHAEQCGIANMILDERKQMEAILIVAKMPEGEKFTPCGQCRDWIMQFGGPTCLIGAQSSPDKEIFHSIAGELVPNYPFMGIDLSELGSVQRV